MIEKKLKSGRKVLINEMSLDDIDGCKDMVQVIFDEGLVQTVKGLNKQKTAWIRKGLGGGDFKNWGEKNILAPDNVIKQLSESEKDELIDLIQGCQILGEDNPSSSK